MMPQEDLDKLGVGLATEDLCNQVDHFVNQLCGPKPDILDKPAYSAYLAKRSELRREALIAAAAAVRRLRIERPADEIPVHAQSNPVRSPRTLYDVTAYIESRLGKLRMKDSDTWYLEKELEAVLKFIGADKPANLETDGRADPKSV